MKPHEYTLNGRVYGLRGCAADGKSHSGFVWPLTVGAEVTAPDWNPAPVCGGGLHFLPWGVGDVGLLPNENETVYMVVSAVDPVAIDRDKCKAQTCRVEFVGQRHEAANYLAGLGAPYAVPFVALTGGDRSTLTAGHQSTLTAGYGSTLTAGDRSTLTGGTWSTLTGGDDSTLTGGNQSTLTGGAWSTLTGGDRSTLTGGDGSTLTGGDRSTLTGGDRSTLTGGDGSTLTGGDGSTLTGGDGSTLTGGDGSTLTGGRWSTLAGGRWSTLVWTMWDGNRRRLHVAYVGEDGIKQNTPYTFADGKIAEVTK